ncbi:S8 family serine peptidase [Candidatus Gracilibacteria bacterium]|nr:S8 family serine peptidase [Candidatus Gracilibacteria bacterium]
MKKLLSLLLLVFFLVSSLNCGTIYAYEVSALESTKDKSIEILENVEKVVDKTIEKIDNKTNDAEIEARLEQKQEEIKEYLEEAKEKIEGENSKGDIKEILEETKKVVVLKVVSGVTEYENIDESIPKELAKTEESKEHAIDVIQNSLETKSGDYSLIIKTKFDKEKVIKTLSLFDEKLKVDFMYESEGDNYFEIAISDDSIFRKEMLEDIESGNIPESFLGITIIKPEVFGINELNIQEEMIGENLESTRGVKLYDTTKYFNALKDSPKTIKVGIVDTGIDYNHPDIKGKVVLGYDFVNDDNDAMDDQGHGTHVSGTIAANLNKAGIIGVNPYVQLVPLKICDSKGFCPTYAVIKALEYAKEKKIDVLNMSLGGRGDPKTSPICDGIDSVVKGGSIVVTAAGNSNVDTSTFVPGGCSQAITVAAVDSNLTRASFSNYGSKVDVSAPGVKVYSTYPGNNYKELSGTSMATPHIVGLVSIIKSLKPELSKDEVLSLIRDNPLPVKTDNGKQIAYFANVGTIVDYLTAKKVVVEEKTPVIETISHIEENKTEELKDNSIIDPDLVFIENQENIGIPEDTPDESYIPNSTTIQEIKMDFGDKNTSLVINSDLSTSFELIDIKEPVENPRPYSNSPLVQSFNANGSIVKINSADDTEEEIDEGEEIPSTGNEVGPDFDINNLPERQVEDEVIEESVEENIEEEITPEKKVIRLDGGDGSVEINSVGDEETVENYDETDFTEIELKEYKENNIIDENGNIIENVNLSEFQKDSEGSEDGEGVEINSAEGEEFDNYGYGENGPITETPTDLGNLAEENMGIQNASGPIKVSSISHTFGNITDSSLYEGYIGYAGYKYPMNYSARGSYGSNYIEAKTVDNSFSLFTKDRFDYKNYTTPKEFTGKFKANFPTSNVGRNQYGYIGISNSDENDILLSLGITTYQYHSLRYAKKKKRGNFICDKNTSWDEVECFNNNYEAGRFLQLQYKKENGKYSVVNYKLPDYLSGEYTIEYSVDFETKNIKAKIIDINGVTKEDLNISFSKLSNYTNINFTDYKYVVRSGVTNNSNQRIYPIEIGVEFGEEQPLIRLSELKTQVGSIDIDNQYSINLNFKGFSKVNNNSPLDYYYSFNGINYNKIIEENGVEVNNTEDTSEIKDIEKSITIDTSKERDGEINIFTKAMNGGVESNVLKIKLLKDTNPLEAPTEFTTRDIMHDKVTYSWKDNSSGKYDEKKFVIKDETGKIVVDNIPANTTSFTESSLKPNTTYKRMICSQLDSFESCTNIIMYSTPNPPRIVQASFYEKLNYYTGVRNYNYSLSNEGIVKINNRGGLYLEGVIAGETEVYFKDNYGRITDIFKVKVLERPKPKTYNVELNAGDSYYIDFGEDISSYYFSMNTVTKENMFKKVQVGRSSLYLDTNGIGESTIIIRDNKGYQFEKYVINLKVKVNEDNFTLNSTDKISVSFMSKYDRTIEDRSVASLYEQGNKKYIEGGKVGKTKVYFRYNGGLRKIFNITVNPIPAPKVIDVTTEIGKQIYYDGDMENGYNYTESKRSMLRFRKYKTALRIYADATGKATVYIRSPTGRYITHIFNITVNPLPVKLFNCETPVGVKCESYPYGSMEGYYYQVSKPGIVDLFVNRNFYPGTSIKYDELQVKGLKEGEVDVYVYKLGDHIATIKTKVLPPVSPIRINPSSLRIKERQGKKLSILAGGGEYKRGTYDDKFIGFSVSSSDNEAKVTGKKPGITYPTITDKYGQTTEIKVTVLDSVLKLDKDYVEIKVNDDYGYINIDDYYIGIKQIKKNNDNVSAFIYEYKDESGEDRKQLRIKGIINGESIVELEDYEGTKRTVKVNIGGGSSSGGGNGGNNGDIEKPVSPEEEEKAMQEIDDFLNQLFKENGIEINSVDEGVEVNSTPDAFRCEYKREGEFRVRPYYSLCVDNDTINGNAWKCLTGYKDLSNDGYNSNTCIKGEYIKEVYKYKNGREALKEKIKKYNKAIIEEISKKLIEKRKKIMLGNGSELSKAVASFIYDDIINEFDKKIDPKYKDRDDLLHFYRALVLNSNNGQFCPDGCFTNDLYKGKTRTEIQNYAQIFAEKLFSYKLDYDKEFKNNFYNQVAEIKKSGGTQEEIEKGVRDGIVEGTKDYLMTYYDAIKSADELWHDLSFESIERGVSSVWGYVKDPVNTFNKAYSGGKEIVNNLYEKILSLTGYEKAKGGSYVGTSLSLSIADPTSKVLQLAGAGFFTKLVGKVDNLIIGKLKYSSKILGQMEERKWTKNDIENVVKKPYKKGKSIDNFDGRNDPATAYFISDNQYIVVNNRTGDIVQISDKNYLDWKVDARIYDIK